MGPSFVRRRPCRVRTDKVSATENGGFRKRSPDWRFSKTPFSCEPEVYGAIWADFKSDSMYSNACCYMLNVHGEYLKTRINIMKMLSVLTSQNSQKIVLKRLKKKLASPRLHGDSG